MIRKNFQCSPGCHNAYNLLRLAPAALSSTRHRICMKMFVFLIREEWHFFFLARWRVINVVRYVIWVSVYVGWEVYRVKWGWLRGDGWLMLSGMWFGSVWTWDGRFRGWNGGWLRGDGWLMFLGMWSGSVCSVGLIQLSNRKALFFPYMLIL